VVARSEADCADAVDAIRRAGGSADHLSADLTAPDSIRALAAAYGAGADRLHILVNNAGRMIEEDLDDYSVESWDAVVALDLRAPFLMVQAFLPLLRAAADPEDPARIINIGSVDGIKPPFLQTYPYPASKAGIHQLTRQLARTLGPQGIAVNAIAPGAFPSRTADPVLAQHLADFVAITPLRRIGRPDDMAGTAVYMASRAGAFLNGSIVVLDGGLVA
jgi:NAD(P)-dependent dehydrogenase (short-subunit alcohol dehydrogenase family)